MALKHDRIMVPGAPQAPEVEGWKEKVLCDFYKKKEPLRIYLQNLEFLILLKLLKPVNALEIKD